MFRLVGLQLITIGLLAAAVWTVWGSVPAFSLILGGLSYIVPTFVAVLLLKFLRPYPALAGSGFILAEALKIILCLVLMILSFMLYGSLHFIAYFVGLLSASHFAFLFFLKVHRHGK